ncbi:tRNA (adenosine(37)-N6)-dimethylallyltransferase MiaA [Pedobacter sp. SD-b]|uniref:tRNA dimethylallyltransferase n=1 Tax=Pedobacter segetis TaxID=2793069 RepID=A0ABS1BK06_9SPHI|nr:tRNA (adenosine(37)-N6)-dimethylallyltransferase MiaA [Pedobacter segetis]
MDLKTNKTLITIVGPTAIGKTALAIALANHYKTEIISADSRQFFREMSIGTAKPDQQELAAAPHHFINSQSITQEVSVGSFEKEAINKIDQLFLKHDVLIMAGGSGLYVNAVLYGFDEIPKADENIRENLNQQFKQAGIKPLQHQLKELDPDYYHQVDTNNPQRVIRALEVCLSTGKPFSSFRNAPIKQRNFNTIIIGLDSHRETLYQRINHRVDLMINKGLLREVESLKEYQHLNALKTVGYSEIFNYLNGEWTLAQAIDKIKQNTRNFAKRQLTWFRRNKDVVWFKPDEEEKILSFIKEKIYKT